MSSQEQWMEEITVDSVINDVEDWIGGNVTDGDFDSMSFTRMMRHKLDTLLTTQIEAAEKRGREEVACRVAEIKSTPETDLELRDYIASLTNHN